MTLKGYSPVHETLATSYGLQKLGLGVLEKLSALMLQAAANSDNTQYTASCVVEFSMHAAQSSRGSVFQERLLSALEEVATFIRYHYPSILGKAYLINPCDEYLACLDVDEELLRETILLKAPEELSEYLGSEIPPRYGGTGKSFAESDLLRASPLDRDSTVHDSLEKPDTTTPAGSKSEEAGMDEAALGPALDTGSKIPEDLDEDEPKLRLIYSESIGPPSIILDPDDLKTAQNLCPDKMGASIYFADSETLVKFGHGVRLAEAEALHLVSTQTTIATPKLVSAYILDDIGYILMSYEPGKPLEEYWDHASEAEQAGVLEQLRDYVTQMQKIQGDFIGGLDRSPCRDGIFEAGYGDYTKYSYGPYESEESFNEGIVQALRDRLLPKVLARENDLESVFFNGEYMLYQTVRGLKDHKIVFTHGDLHPGNMIVRTDGTIVLVDWGSAGFWPEYWEFYRALFNPPWRVSWDRMVEKFIPPHYVEYSVLKRVFGTMWN